MLTSYAHLVFSLEYNSPHLHSYHVSNQFGIHQQLPHEEDRLYSQTQEIIEATTTYMKKMWSDPQYKRVNYKCRNMHEDCAYWVATGECEANPTYMQTNCAPSCQTCESLDIRLRCPILPENELVLKPGGLNELMERIVDNSDGKGEYLKYNPKAASRPKLKKDGTESGVDVDGPWIVVFENFVSDEEATALIEAGAKKGYERSADVGIENPDGSHEDDVNDDRTSHNAWCDDELCNNDPVIAPVIERIATVTKTSVNNSEFLQLLQYEPGQVSVLVWSGCSLNRILTCYLSLLHSTISNIMITLSIKVRGWLIYRCVMNGSMCILS